MVKDGTTMLVGVDSLPHLPNLDGGASDGDLDNAWQVQCNSPSTRSGSSLKSNEPSTATAVNARQRGIGMVKTEKVAGEVKVKSS